MKTIYLTFVFLMLIFFVTGCGDSGKVLIASGEGTSYEDGSDEDLISTDDTGNTTNIGDASDDGLSGGESEENSAAKGSAANDTVDHVLSDGGNAESGTTGSSQRIYVFVCGHVKSPGVYELALGSRICDALSMAGGVAEDGAYEALDQAKQVVDGETLYVPGVDEEWEHSLSRENANAEAVSGNSETGDGKVNINSASKEELMTLPGIGESKASDIITYREEHGGFSSVEDIMNIQGIKEGVYNKIKDRITI